MKRVWMGTLMAICFGWAGLDQAAQLAPEGSSYHVIQTVPLPGDGGWDFLTVDAASRRIYLTHADSVQVVDADSLTLVGTVANVKRPHGVVVLPELGKGYATSGDPGSVVVFDLKTFKRLSEIPTAKDCDVILYDKVARHVLTFNGDSHNCTVMDPATDKTLETINLGGAPEVAVSDGKGHLYDNLEDKSEIVKLDSRKLKIQGSWLLAPGQSPSGLAMDLTHNRLFSACRNKLLVVTNAKTGKVVQTLPIGEHVDGAYFDPASATVFTSNGDGTLTVIHEDAPEKYSVVENVKTEPGARTLAFDSKTGRIFLSVAESEAAPAPTADNPKPRRKIVPGTFHLLVVGE